MPAKDHETAIKIKTLADVVDERLSDLPQDSKLTAALLTCVARHLILNAKTANNDLDPIRQAMLIMLDRKLAVQILDENLISLY